MDLNFALKCVSISPKSRDLLFYVFLVLHNLLNILSMRGKPLFLSHILVVVLLRTCSEAFFLKILLARGHMPSFI